MHPRLVSPLFALTLTSASLAQAPHDLIVLAGEANGSNLGHAAAFVGDWDQDGRAEVAFGAPGIGRVSVYRHDGTMIRGFHGGLVAGDRFGHAIAGLGDVDGDGVPDLVVGAPELSGAIGGVFVISGASGATLRSWFGTQSGERLGSAVAALGDVDGDGVIDFAASGLQAFAGGLGFVWIRSGRTGALLRGFAGSYSGEGFGFALARAGDVDGDGVQDLAVGAPWATRRALLGGAAWVYSGASGAVVGFQSGVIDFESFGHAVGTADADWNGDGKQEWLVGAPGNDEGAGFESGSLFVLGAYDPLNQRSAVLLRYDGAAGDALGAAVAGGGDVNGDGAPDIAAASVSGYVRLLSGRGGHAVLDTLPAREANDRFGFAIAFGGDQNLDGYGDLAIGAPWDGGVNAGRGYVVDLGWKNPTVLFTRPGSASGQNLGRHIAYVGDWDGDLRAEIAISVPGSNRIDIHRADGALLRSISAGVGPLSSSSIAAAGDVNGDGVPDLIVGDPGDDTGGINAGRVRVFSGSDGSVLHSFLGAGSEYLGWSVAGLSDIDEDGYDDIAAGAPQDPDPHGGIPVNYVRVWSGRTGNVLRTFSSPADTSFGYDIARAGDLDGDGTPDILIGAPNADVRATDGGAIYGYSGRSFAQIASQSGNTAFENFALSVSALDDDWDGDGLDDYVAGSFKNDDGAGSEAGSLFVINRFGNVIRRFDGAPGQHFGLQVTGGGDVDGDGKMEIAATSENLDQIWIFSGASSHERLRVFSNHGFFPVLDLAGDFDGDGYADLAVGCFSAEQLAGRAWIYDLRGAEHPPRKLYSGRACSTSTNRLPRAVVSGRPVLGGALSFGLRSTIPNGPVALQVGTPIDIPLDFAGAPGCRLYTLGDVFYFSTQANFEGRVSLAPVTVPADPVLIGSRFDSQWFLLDSQANPAGLVFSTRAILILGA